MVRTKKASLRFLRRTPLYAAGESGKFILIKKAGLTLEEAGLSLDSLPGRLFVRPEDKLTALKEIQQGLTGELRQKMSEGELTAVRDTMVDLMEETLSDARAGSLEGVSEMVTAVTREYAGKPDVLLSLAKLSFKDYTTALHSVNVMALTLAFCARRGFDQAKLERFGLAGLLHDVGKMVIPEGILTSPRKLTEEEFAQIRRHPLEGHRIIGTCGFSDPIVSLGALEHHEKLDGSGYPRGIADPSPVGRILAVIDCYEAITADERPYREAMDPYPALAVIKAEVDRGKLDRKAFEQFVHTLS